jgi:hypothetical protein
MLLVSNVAQIVQFQKSQKLNDEKKEASHPEDEKYTVMNFSEALPGFEGPPKGGSPPRRGPKSQEEPKKSSCPAPLM